MIIHFKKKVFPDDFHLRTLELILPTFAQLVPTVNIKTIVVSLVDRLANFANGGGKIPSDVNIFDVFSSKIAEIVEVKFSENYFFQKKLFLNYSFFFLTETNFNAS